MLSLGCLLRGLVGVVFPVLAHAEGYDNQSMSYKKLVEHLGSSCPSMAIQALEHPAVKSFTKHDNADLRGVCVCFSGKLMGDRRLRRHLDVESSLLVFRLYDPKVKLYLDGLMHTSMLECMLPIFKASIDNMTIA